MVYRYVGGRGAMPLVENTGLNTSINYFSKKHFVDSSDLKNEVVFLSPSARTLKSKHL